MKRLLAIVASAALASATAAGAAERLVVEPYPGKPAWKEVTNVTRGDQSMREWIPGDQAIESYRDILVAQVYARAPAGITPSSFLQGLFSRFGGACEHVRVNGPKPSTEGGYATAYAQVYCSRQIGQPFGVSTFYKVMLAGGALYVVNRDIRTPPSDVAGVIEFPKGQAEQGLALMRAQGQANDYLVKSVYLCPDASPDPRCARRR